MSYTEGTGTGEDWTEASGETYGAESYETAESVPSPASSEVTETYDDGAYAAASYPGERWDTAPVIEDLAERAWDSITETAEEAWNWATGGEGGAPVDGGGGAEGAPPYYDPGGGGAAPGGVPDEALCGEGACPVCSQDRAMSSGCVLEHGHAGDHQCGYGDTYSQGAADIPPPPPVPKCRTQCPTCGATCMLTLGHDGPHGCGH